MFVIITFVFGKKEKIRWLVVVAELDRMSTVVEKEEHNNSTTHEFDLKLRD